MYRSLSTADIPLHKCAPMKIRLLINSVFVIGCIFRPAVVCCSSNTCCVFRSALGCCSSYTLISYHNNFLAGNNYPDSPHLQGVMKFATQISPLLNFRFAENSPEWNMAMIQYLIDMKNHGHKIKEIETSKVNKLGPQY